MEKLIVVSASGNSGKTTLLNYFAEIILPRNGFVFVSSKTTPQFPIGGPFNFSTPIYDNCYRFERQTEDGLLKIAVSTFGDNVGYVGSALRWLKNLKYSCDVGVIASKGQGDTIGMIEDFAAKNGIVPLYLHNFRTYGPQEGGSWPRDMPRKTRDMAQQIMDLI